MKRTALKALLLFLVGATVSVAIAVALECLLPSLRASSRMRVLHGSDRLWDRFQPPGFPAPTLLSRGDGFGRILFEAFGITSDGSGTSAHLRLAGWPFPCVRGWDRTILPPDQSAGWGAGNSGLLDLGEGRRQWAKRRASTYAVTIPIAPVWWGLIGDSVVWACGAWVIVFGPFALRRVIRRRRALCPACAYPVGRSSVCTECGGSVVPRPLPA